MESRVDRYREYRKEIQNDSEKVITHKSVTSEKVDSERDKNPKSDSLSYDTVLGAHDIYFKDKNFERDPFKGHTRLNIPYVVLSGLALLVLFLVTIFFLLLTFGGIQL